jgi:hypothetical protein
MILFMQNAVCHFILWESMVGAISHHMGLHYVWAFHEMECPPIRLLCMVENIRHMHLVKHGVNFNQFNVCY